MRALKGWINLQAANAFGCEERGFCTPKEMFSACTARTGLKIFSGLVSQGARTRERVLSREHQTECTSTECCSLCITSKEHAPFAWVCGARAATTAAPFSYPSSWLLSEKRESFFSTVQLWRQGDLCSLFWAINYFYNSIPLEKDKSCAIFRRDWEF